MQSEARQKLISAVFTIGEKLGSSRRENQSMSNPNEPAKTLLPYLQRADELQKHEPLVAYYCRLYAMERGLKIPQGERTKTTNSILMSLINQLEKDKKSLNLSPDDNMHVEGFALNVFAKADKQDRAGRADLSTAKTFYAASIFFEILSQFGPVPPDIEQKQKYAIWKAADIRKAIKEGRKPIPGDPVDDDNDDLSIPSSGPSGSHDIGPSDTNITSHHRTEPDQPSHDSNDDSSHHHFPEVPQHPLPPRFHDNPNNDYPTDVPPPPPSSYSSNDLLPPPMGPSDSPYTNTYSHQSYHQDPPQHMPPPQNYPSHEPSPNSLPNFQSYPSFSESSLPSTPSQYPSHYQNPDRYYSSPHSAPAPSSTSFASAPPPPYSSSNGRTNIAPVVDPAPSPVQKYHYDSSYQPGPEKIAEAHRAARFAVGALAFDEVSTAVAHLKKSLELLTNPSASH